MGLLSYSESLVARSAENVNKLNTILNEIKAAVNSIDNAKVAADAAIAWTKLATAGKIKNVDIAADAAIAAGKLALSNAITTAMLQDNSVTDAKKAPPTSYVYAPAGAGVNADATNTGVIVSGSMPEGYYLYLCNLHCQMNSGLPNVVGRARALKNLVQIDDEVEVIFTADSNNPTFQLHLHGIFYSDGNDILTIVVDGIDPGFEVYVEAVDSTLTMLKLN